MDAILLAGGYGTRLRPLTYTRPKPLLPVAGRPMLEWVLDRLPPEVHRVIVAVNWRAQTLGAYFNQRATRAAGDRREFVVVREEEPLGTGGAVKNCERHLTGDRFFVLNADIVSNLDMGAMLTAHKLHGGVGTISLKEVEPAEVVNYGVIKPGGPAHAAGAIPIADFVEKPKDPAMAPSRLINAGAYLLDRSVLDLIPAGKMVSMEKETFPHLVPKGFYGLPLHGHWIDVGDPTRLRQASTTLDPKFRFGPGTRLADGARFEDSLAGKECHIGVGAHLERCILGDGVTIQAGVHLADCVVGDNESVSHSGHGQRIWTKPIPAGYPQKQVGNALA
ncbi:MAG TPA: NDP-sugar synthase [Candidatus Thermoplasmatota archaeon]|nr:NDP-sugar synthase [Candidatus Thermoplasmatota archaeon]